MKKQLIIVLCVCMLLTFMFMTEGFANNFDDCENKSQFVQVDSEKNDKFDFVILCSVVNSSGPALYYQSFFGINEGSQTIEAPSFDNYKLISQSPKTMNITRDNNVLEFKYEYITDEGDDFSNEPQKIKELDINNTEELAALTINCVEKTNPNNVLYSMTICNISLGTVQNVSAPSVKGYKFSGGNYNVREDIQDIHNVITFEYDKNETINAPVMNYTLSDTENTWDPVTVNLEITDDDGISDVRYIRMTGGWNYWPPIIDTVSVSKDFDYFKTKEIFENTDDFVSYLGGPEKAALIMDYYENAYTYTSDDVNWTPILTAPNVIGNEFDVTLNGDYLIAAMDTNGNITIKYVPVFNINIPSASVEFKKVDDYSGEYIASAQLVDMVENPNAPNKDVHLIKHCWQLNYAGGSYSDIYEYTKIRLNAYLNLGREIEPINGQYNLKDFGEYVLIIGDEWGNYSEQKFKLAPDSKENIPIVEYKYTRNSDTTLTVDMNILQEEQIAKIEYAKCGDSSSGSGYAKPEGIFISCEDRKTVNNQSFKINEDGIYVIRVMNKYGNSDFKIIDTKDFNYNLNISFEKDFGNIFCKITNVSGKIQDGVLLISYYDDNGALVKSEMIQISITAGEDDKFSIGISESEKSKVKTIKAFVWNSLENMNAESLYTEYIVDRATN